MMDSFSRMVNLRNSGRKRSQLYMTLTQFDRKHGGAQSFVKKHYGELYGAAEWKRSKSSRLYSLELSLNKLKIEWGDNKLEKFNTDEEGSLTKREVVSPIMMKYNRDTQRLFLSYKVVEKQRVTVRGRIGWVLV